MQENNNFETILSKWRRLSLEEPTEQKDSVAITSMSSESSSHQTKKPEEESNLLAPDRSGHVPVAIMGAGAAAASELPSDISSTNPEEKQEFIKQEKDDSKDAAGDTSDTDKKSEKDHLENDKKPTDGKTEKDKMGDNTDSVFLRSPPPHKTRSTASTAEEEDCGIKCLYYTLQCCDCVLM